MKRSRSIVLTGLMAGTGFSLSACELSDTGKQVDAVSYTSVAECRAAGTVPAAQCETAYAEAAKADAKTAPRFEDRKTCEEQFGAAQCVPRNENGGSFFTPLLTGFIIGQALNNAGGGYRGAPMYRDRDGSYYGGAGGMVSRDYVTGRTRVGSEAFNPAARAPTRIQSRSSVISRGGFGGGGRGFGG